jgi:hypothetical protein
LTADFPMKFSASMKNCDSRAWWISTQNTICQKVGKKKINRHLHFSVWLDHCYILLFKLPILIRKITFLVDVFFHRGEGFSEMGLEYFNSLRSLYLHCFYLTGSKVFWFSEQKVLKSWQLQMQNFWNCLYIMHSPNL